MSHPSISIDKLISAISHRTRWRILNEILKEDVSFPASELARRFGLSLTSMCKHIKVLCEAGVLQASYGNHYLVPAHWRVPGERTLDLGAVVLRLDRLDGEEEAQKR